MKTLRNSQRGSALIGVIVSVSVLTGVAAYSVSRVLTRSHTLSESAVWEESLSAADAGIHQGLAQLEQGLALNSLPTGTQTFQMQLSHGGERSTSATVTYTLTRNDVTVGGMVRPYYSIVSSGSVSLPGGRSITSDSRDTVVRKLNLNGSNTSAGRTIETWAKPVYTSDTALRADRSITLNNHNITVDSFDSGDTTRSLTGGQPPATVGQFNVAPYNIMRANVGTNSNFIEAGNATIYGDAMTNGGTVGSTAGIMGEIRDDYYEPIAPVYAPSWASTATQGVTTSKKTATMTVNAAATIRGGTQSSPARYVVNSISLAGNSDVVTFDYGMNGLNGSVDYTKAYVELYVIGDFTTKGGGTTSTDSGSVVIVNGVQVKIWVGGNLNLSGNGLTNNNSLASSLSIYGINPTDTTTSQTVTLAGSSRFYGSVYAPGADLKLAGGGSDGTFVGSLTGKTAYLNGNTQIRYDEALSGQGLITRFKATGWFEDVKKAGSFSGTL